MQDTNVSKASAVSMFTQMMEAACFAETSVHITTRYHNPDDRNLTFIPVKKSNLN